MKSKVKNVRILSESTEKSGDFTIKKTVAAYEIVCKHGGPNLCNRD